jgi:hypothetical protein
LLDQITFEVTSFNASVTDLYFYYRIEDKLTLAISEWKNAGKMEHSGVNKYTITFKALDIHPDLRLDQAWFDYQFVGVNKSEQAVGRSDKLAKLVTFTNECP